MSRFEAWLLHLGSVLVGGTGLVYAWMRYLAVPADPEAVVGHPWQPAVQHLHVLTAPLLVLAVGALFHAHAWTALRLGVRDGRASGLVLLASALPMIASGYLLQTAVDPGWRRLWVAVHLVSSGLWIAGHLAHVARRLRGRPPD
ncbi:MAG: hypothetical protein M5U13_18120 [Thermoanaerobaculia bacterium]|nr:hypothetical protein [Thermoanaerobaculia bacterium]